MTTFTTFAPTPFAPFSFQPTLDGGQYFATLTWNLFSQRYYINIYDLNGNLIVAKALTGSDTGFNLSMITWANGMAFATTVTPHGYKLGSTVNLTISGVVPDAYNGVVSALITGTSTFLYPLQANPGVVTQNGIVTYDISMTVGYFDSTLVYRVATNQFEVSP